MRPTVIAAALALVMLGTAGAGAQQIRLTISGLPLTKTSTPITDFDAGSTLYGTTSFEVDVRNSGPLAATTVSVRCATPCPATGSQSVSRVEFLRTGDATWRPLSLAYQVVETRNALFNGTNDPWTGTISWRYVLDWVLTPPSATASRFDLQFQLTVAAP